MFSLERTETCEQIVKKSRFRAVAAPISGEQDVRDLLATHSDPDANHNCWAWRIGQNYRFSDDGEPSGTAGKPILQAIDGQSLDNVIVVVTRWFGGVLLGTGGLIRAYGGTAAICLRAAGTVELVAMVDVVIRVGFSDLALVKARLAAAPGVRVASEAFLDDGAELTLAIPEAISREVARSIADATSGRVIMTFQP
ncbi:YigZ family protein [Rhizobium sp. S152]|uniref:IMPACT family protein n=1 Tax=Rhizobium sp. S152 TaxID=3055038 RepID=UPI0025A939F9|nr:YigZ family protein [Rhizobium sp. S152]MDM9625910.1 YigZ family protein [Rhizobium sp. S152]